jgi:hypothetical protein
MASRPRKLRMIQAKLLPLRQLLPQKNLPESSRLMEFIASMVSYNARVEETLELRLKKTLSKQCQAQGK